MKSTTFEDFLQDKHAAQYQGLDDEMGEDYEEWLSELDLDVIIAYANLYGSERSSARAKECLDVVLETTGKKLTPDQEKATQGGVDQ